MQPIKTTLITLVLAIASGCATSTTQPTGPERLQRLTDTAVFIYAREKMRNSPESRPKFVAAQQSLQIMVDEKIWDITTFGKILSTTGATKLSAEELVLIVTTADTIASTVSGGIDLSKSEYAQALVTGGFNGLTSAIK